MPVLLLCYGDPAAKDLLRKAIDARYAINPPVVDALKISFKGKTQVKVGPVKSWVPLDVTAHFKFPTQMRWDFVAKPMGLPVRRGIESLSHDVYRSNRNNNTPEVIDDPILIVSARRRLWSIAALLLTPISDTHIKLTAMGARSFEALNTKLNDAVTVHLRDDHTLERVESRCYNPETETQQTFALHISEEQEPVGDFMLPKKISVHWDDTPSFEMEAKDTVSNPTLSEALFDLSEDI